MNATAGIPDSDAEELFRKYWPMALRRCRSMLGDAESAADAAQEVFVKVLDKRHTLKAEYPSSLLWTMATNHCLNVLRSRARRAEVSGGDSLIERIACSSDIEAEAGRRGLLTKIFRQHPENSRTIAVLHFVDGMTLEETAREVGMSVSGVRKRLRALRDSALKITEVDV
jgi:RNA polymerase sigma-70 factor (ECF subfamily)